MKKVYFAEYESRKFVFRLVAPSERQARALMLKALRKHGRDFELYRDWFYPDSVTVVEMPVGVAFRDYDQI